MQTKTVSIKCADKSRTCSYRYSFQSIEEKCLHVKAKEGECCLEKFKRLSV